MNLAGALIKAQEARWKYDQSTHDIDPPAVLDDALTVEVQILLEGLEAMEWAYSYVENDGPVPAETRNGANWRTPVPPELLAHLADLSTDEDRAFRIQANENAAKHQRSESQKTFEADAHCPRGNDCKTRRVTWPGKDLGPACWRHVTEEERDELSSLYDQAVQTLSCRACHAAINSPCVESTMQTRIDGYFSPVRSFNKRKVHRVRLDDYAKAI